MPLINLDGIQTNYIKYGKGPHLLMMAPKGFDSSLSSWDHGKWKDMDAIKRLSSAFTVIAYDRRESGLSGGRVEMLNWNVYAHQAKLLIEHLQIEKTYVLGVCMGVGVATQFASNYPNACMGMILAQPVGGVRWQHRMHQFFNRHISFVREFGLTAVIARSEGKNFMSDPEGGPWTKNISSDKNFANYFHSFDCNEYLSIVERSRDALFPDSFVSGPGWNELILTDVPASIWPGNDASHSTSSAHQLRELLPKMEFWDLKPSEQNADNMFAKILAFEEKLRSGNFPISPEISSPLMPAVSYKNKL